MSAEIGLDVAGDAEKRKLVLSGGQGAHEYVNQPPEEDVSLEQTGTSPCLQ